MANAKIEFQTSATPLPLVLVGGGSDVIDASWQLEGVSEIIKPPSYSVANAVGAAACQVSGAVDVIEKIDASNDVASIKKRASERAVQLAIENGADPSTVQVRMFECFEFSAICQHHCDCRS